ncbi:MAG: DNA cytosine methyltransferase [Candidatus Nanopelagicales bacterium]|nr:DNA cytosine methyltransferase [Candidatus Nanopelagicales bacterium]
MHLRRITTVDLFAGAGGLSLGFARAGLGFTPVLGVEVDAAAARTFQGNFGCEVYDGPIEGVDVFPEADVVVGGPPCQGFSPLGRDRDDASRGQLNELWRHYLSAVREIRPRAFVIENVPQFQRSTQFADLLQVMRQDPDLTSYAYSFGVLNAADYGVPQSRRRGILMAVRDADHVPWPPTPTHGPDSLTGLPHRTVRDAIGDLPVGTRGFDVSIGSEGEQLLHFGRRPRPASIERYRSIPEGGNRFDLALRRPDLLSRCWREKPSGTSDVMGRLWWDRPSVTIRTEFFKPEKGRYLHPSAHRPISHREAARLQTFPDDFVFEGNKIEIARQIGNAVPVALGEALARHLSTFAFAPGCALAALPANSGVSTVPPR